MIDVVIPRIGESIQTVLVSRWIKRPGDSVAEGDPVLELDSDKASMEVPAPASGVIKEVLVAEGEEIAIGAVVARIEAGAVARAPAGDAPTPAPADVRAGPAARQKADTAGVALGSVSGTGPRGRVTSKDVDRAATSPAPAAIAPSAPLVPVSTGLSRRVPMSPLRRTIARRLLEASTQTAMLTTFNEVDMSRIMALRKTWQDKFVERHGVKLGFMSFFCRAVVEALKEFPAVNAEIDGDAIVYKDFYHLGVAVSGPKGLVVPVLRDADRLGFAETEKGIAALAERARANKLLPADFEGGTVTISTGGIFGSMMSTPILNPPQSGIWGMHNIVERPSGVIGQGVLRPMLSLALSYDHRLIDGREAVGFLVRVKAAIEDPDRLLLEI